MTPMEIEWAEPPPHALKPVGKYPGFAQALRENPGKWAKLPGADTRTVKGAAGTAQNIRRGVMKDFKPKGAFDAAPDGSTVYVRYVGDPQTTAESLADEPEQQQPANGHPLQVNPAEVRAWARTNGFNVPERGRMPENIYVAYANAQQRPAREVPEQ